MVLSWGKPKLEIKKLGVTPGAWVELPIPVEDTTNMNTEKGEKKEAKEEGGGLVDAMYKKSKYSLVFELFAKKDDKKPIEDIDGIVLDNYAIRLTPEDITVQGYLIDKANVSVVDKWSSADGGRIEYTFDALTPDDGSKIVKRHIDGEIFDEDKL